MAKNHTTAKAFMQSLDYNGDGQINALMLGRALDKMGISTSRVDFNELINIVDTNGDGLLSINEFLQALRKNKQQKARQRNNTLITENNPNEGKTEKRNPGIHEKRKPGLDVFDLEQELSHLVGQESVKKFLLQWEKGLKLDRRREEVFNRIVRVDPPHMCFLGNPGTGKTKIAVLVASVLAQLGLVAKGELVQVQRADLVAGAIGQTAIKTKAKIEEAKGGVLFIDEAYRLFQEESTKDFGREAIDEIMAAMNTGDVVMIFAGYRKEMQAFMGGNPGLFRRISKQFFFEDYKTDELTNILKLNVKLSGFQLDTEVTDEQLTDIIERKTIARQRAQMNGGIPQQMFRKAKWFLDERLDMDACEDELMTFNLGDLENSLEEMKNNWSQFAPDDEEGDIRSSVINLEVGRDSLVS